MFLVPCFLTFTTSFSGTDVSTAVGNQPKLFCYTDNSEMPREGYRVCYKKSALSDAFP